MLEQAAEVLVAEPGSTWVRAVEPSGCGSCGGQGCSTRRIAELFRRDPRGFRVDSELSLTPGERVVIGIPDGSVLAGALRVYGLPLAAMLLGALLSQVWLPGDAAALAGLLAGGGLGFLFARGGRAARPVVLRRSPPDNCTIHLEKG
ncbi:MAG: SoxR reducing system RseC family protein [Thiobacillus sp.]|nr:SoxR reducing system RseC family protein [Thiobacillus sp.]